MKVPTAVFLALLCVSEIHATWLDDINKAMQQAGVDTESAKSYTEKVKTYTDNINGAITTVQGTINNIVDKVDWKRLYQISTEKIKPNLQTSLPPSICAQNVGLKSFSSDVQLFDAKIKKIRDFTSTVKVLEETDKDIKVEFRLEYEILHLKYNFTYTNLLLEDIYTVKKQGRLLLVQKPPAYVSIYGRVPKMSTALSDLLKKGSCIIKLQSVEATISGEIIAHRIQYESSGLGYTEKTVSGLIERARLAIHKYTAEALASGIETEIRKMTNLFCVPETPQEKYDCSVTNHKKLAY